MKLGSTYMWHSHLWVVISLPDEIGEVVVVNLTSHRDNKDQSCVIEAGEHPFVNW